MSTKFICICGKARAGKDTTAERIEKCLKNNGRKVLTIHYADLVKFICNKCFDWDGQKDEKGRSLLQYVGTERVRTKRPNYWVSFVIDIAELFPDEWEYIIVPDTRFPNEIEVPKSRGFEVISVRIQRPNFNSPLTAEQQQHSSEVALDDYSMDYVIDNKGSLEDIDVEVDKFCKILCKEDKL